MTPLRLTKIKQTFPRPRLDDVRGALVAALAPVQVAIRPGARIAITAGSRGIANYAALVKTVVDFVRDAGGEPFIIPAMGSHGGATPEGQAGVLADYGITEAAMGAPIRSSLDVVEIPAPDLPNAVYMDRYAYEADGVILLNRIKPHTAFHGDYESGLVKMAVIGLGKHRQATAVHSYGVRGLREWMPPTAQRILATGKVLFGVAVVENAYDETLLVKVLPADAIMAEEPSLLGLAKANMPCLPVDDVDVLLIDRMGKDLSGTGIDPNIIGRMLIRGVPEPERPRIKALVVHDLTDGSHGNATGIGMANVTTRRLFDKLDFAATYANVTTSTFLDRARIPPVAATDAQAYEWALISCNQLPPGQERILRIPNTLHLSEVYVSPAVLAEIKGQPGIEVIGEPQEMFDADGTLLPF